MIMLLSTRFSFFAATGGFHLSPHTPTRVPRLSAPERSMFTMTTTSAETHLPSTTLLDWFQSTSARVPSILLMDGGVSTHLEQLISPKSFSHRELWSSSLLLTTEGRDFVQKGHLDWLNAGSDIITTVTYQCHYGLLVAVDGGDDDVKKNDGMVVSPTTMTEMIENGVKLARTATQQSSSRHERFFGPFVVASTGPYGAAMADGSEYTGAYPPQVTPQALKEFHHKKAVALWRCCPDGLAVETIPNLQEVGAVCQVLQELKQQQDSSSTGCCCWISLACRNGTELNDGNALQDALNVIRSMDPNHQYIAAVGVNCCDSVYIASLAKILARHAIQDSGVGLPPRGIVLYPNSGESWDAAKEEWKDGTGADDSQFADRLMDAVSIIQETCKEHSMKTGTPAAMPRIVLGGCCRTNEKTMAALRRRIDALNGKLNAEG